MAILKNDDFTPMDFVVEILTDYFNMDEKDIIGKTDSDIFTKQQAEINAYESKQILATGLPLAKEINFKRSKEQQWFHVVKVPVYDQDGSIMGLLLTARDISMLKKFQDQLIQSQKMEDLGRLSGGVAHEINTPLGIILGYSQLMMDDIDDAARYLAVLKVISRGREVLLYIRYYLTSQGELRTESCLDDSVDLEKQMKEYIPDIGSGYAEAKFQQVLDMDVSNDYDGNFDDLNSDAYKYETGAGWKPDVENKWPEGHRGFIK